MYLFLDAYIKYFILNDGNKILASSFQFVHLLSINHVKRFFFKTNSSSKFSRKIKKLHYLSTRLYNAT